FVETLPMDWKTHGFDERSDRPGCICVRQHYPVKSRCEDLDEHPGVSVHGRFISAVDGNVDNHGRCAMAAFRRSTGDQPSHIVSETFDIERRMFHVIAYVIGIRLRVRSASLKA